MKTYKEVTMKEQEMHKMFECEKYGCVYIFEQAGNGGVETIWCAPMCINGEYDETAWTEADVETYKITDHDLKPYGQISYDDFLKELELV